MDDAFYLDDQDNYDDNYDDDDDPANEIVGSCENCGSNVYADEAHEINGLDLICDQCAWAIAVANGEIEP